MRMELSIDTPEKYRAALYIRLSREDENEGPSQSVENQLAMLSDFARKQGLSICGRYVDDGWSGTNFDRPAFRRMLADIEAGKIDLVLTKDLSRLGRDYIGTGHYIERWFPEHRVRYISLLDGIDTGVESSANDLTPFRAIMNDMYAKDISKKIGSVKHDKQRRGLFIGGKAPYGYRLTAAQKGCLLVDDMAAAVVRRVFSMCLCGFSSRQIAAKLNAEGVPSPAVYAGLPRQGSGKWSGEAISALLRNECYTGCMVQARSRRVSYKSRKCVRQARSDWVVVPGTHEALVDRQTFEAAARMLDRRTNTRERTHPFLLKGCLFCGDCGAPLGVVARRNTAGDETLYHICRSYQRDGKNGPCSAHSAREDEVRAAVLSSLHSLCAPYLASGVLNGAAAQALADRAGPAGGSDAQAALRQRLAALTQRLDRVYADRLEGLLSEEDFSRIYQKLCLERRQLETSLKACASTRPALPDAAALCAEFAGGAWELPLVQALLCRAELSENRELRIFLRCRPPGSKAALSPAPPAPLRMRNT